jgi:hypothetical protein
MGILLLFVRNTKECPRYYINAMRNVTVVDKTIPSFAKAAFGIEKSVSEEKRTRMTVAGNSYKGKWTV